MSETRRETLKILGAIGATCAFPFAADELYGQHVAVKDAKPAAPRAAPYTPVFFGASEYALVSRLADLIIPATDTPGAIGAGVPEYIDRVVSLNPEHQGLMRAGLDWIDGRSRELSGARFLDAHETQQIRILQPLSDEVDRRRRASRAPAATAPTESVSPADVPVRFFRLVKNLTADGYYTSRVGLLDELGYKGNTALARFPSCTVPEH